jgi:hypothetical protein
MIGDTPLDKDGISALGVVSEMAHAVYAGGATMHQQLQEAYKTYGYYITKNKYVGPALFFRLFLPIVFLKVVTPSFFFLFVLRAQMLIFRYFFAYDTKIQPIVFKDLRNEGKYHKTCGPYAIKV